ncbi:Zinc/iron permease [Terfezia boudieri ATCC MYA-4762]|uniref:Zinc/iron permease n=1 Tax=Terfezia boudieri ATCC MYA-4762 TaxID=1051890 RepID=A0A3N4LHE9_9PEZI|nr:Zinc/iron permease [Terfezia boudieri ATCC MYA-4762]
MAEGLPTLILFGIAMAAASFSSGMLPLTLTLTKSHLRLISTLGMGVLVGTSLIVIIPEGIETLYSITSRHKRSDHDQDSDDSDDEDDHSSYNPHAYVGLALIAGFILMYLIDTLPPIIAARTNPSKPSYITLSSLGNNTTTPDPDAPSSPTSHPLQPYTNSSPSSSSFSTTLGLVIHSLADGIALGASSTSSNLSLSFIIFLAILLHKAPASFALSSVLLKSGLSKRAARIHLLIFSLAAPAGALATWVVVSILGGVDDKAKMAWWTGMLLLFSGGTFL